MSPPVAFPGAQSKAVPLNPDSQTCVLSVLHAACLSPEWQLSRRVTGFLSVASAPWNCERYRLEAKGRILTLFLCLVRFYRSVPRTWELTSACTWTARCSRSTQPSGWPVMAACGPWRWSSRLYIVPQGISSTMQERVSTASASWSRAPWR